MSTMNGKVALVSGASRGIGKVTAQRLAEKGASLFLAADGTREELETLAADCRRRQQGDGDARFGLYDLSEIEAPRAMVESALDAFGRVDVLVNNAGVRCRKPFGEFTQEDFEFVVNVNIRAAFFASQAVLPAMRKAGGGRIIHVASQFGTVAFQDHALYGLTKAALIHLTRSMALELGPDGIIVNAVSPGPIATQYNIDRLADKPELRLKMESYVPLRRFGKPEEVAEAIVFLASCEGTFIHGHDLLVDGGFIIH